MVFNPRFVFSAALLFTGACSSGLSSPATYIARGPTFGIMLQLDPATGNHITGTISSAEVIANGGVDGSSKPISGTIDGGAVNFTVINPAGNDPATVPVSGIETDQGLELTFFAKGRATPLLFHRGSATEFADIVQSVRQQAGGLSGSTNAR